MSIVVEDGTGNPLSQAYVSEADATTYLATVGTPAEWTAASTTEREAALVKACRDLIDGSYRTRWRGDRASREQALDWPRIGVWDSDGWAVDEDQIPVELQRSNAEAAVLILQGEDPLAVQEAGSNIASESNRVGELEESITYTGGGKQTAAKYPRLDTMLQRLLTDRDVVVRA